MNWYMSFVDSYFKRLRMICEILFAGSCTPGEGKIARENWLQSRLLMSLSKKMRVTTVFLVAIVLISMEKVFETRGRGGGISNVPELCLHLGARSCEGYLWERKAAGWQSKFVFGYISRASDYVGRNQRQLGWLANHSEVQKWRNENTTWSQQNSVPWRHQGSRLRSLARYNTFIVTGTTCKQVAKTIEGTMVILYETNPNGSGQLSIDKKLLFSLVTLFLFINTFSYS